MLKQPNGELYEEFVAFGSHDFVDGKCVDSITSAMDGNYTGRFFFKYPNGKTTRWYTTKSAPKWLLAFYREATSQRR